MHFKRTLALFEASCALKDSQYINFGIKIYIHQAGACIEKITRGFGFFVNAWTLGFVKSRFYASYTSCRVRAEYDNHFYALSGV